VRHRLTAARAHLQRAGVHDNGAQAFAFFGSFAEHVFLPGSDQRTIEIVPPRNLPAALLASGPWRANLSWQLVPEHPSRFVLDAQNFVEVWHRDGGYLAGTGGSKFMPRFSTVRRLNQGRAYIPDGARCLRCDTTSAEVSFNFGADAITVGIRLETDRCRITATMNPAGPGTEYEFALILAFRPGESLESEFGVEVLEPKTLLHKNGGPRPQMSFRWRGLDWQLPANALLDYPIVPHNSYTQDGLPRPEDYVGRLSFRLTAEPATIVIRQAAG